MSNVSMPGIMKVGMTLRDPEERLEEANSSNTFKPPTDYCIEFAKRVRNPRQKEEAIHALLEKYTIRINKKREFFRTSADEVRGFFMLLDGDWWGGFREEDLEEDEDDEAPATIQHVHNVIRSSIKATATEASTEKVIGMTVDYGGEEEEESDEFNMGDADDQEDVEDKDVKRVVMPNYEVVPTTGKYKIVRH